MRNDNNIRDYYLKPSITANHVSEELTSIEEIMNTGRLVSDLSLFKFETTDNTGIYQNVFNDYIPFFADNPKNVQRIKFNPASALRFAYKPWSICKALYGNTELYYLIYALNDIEHDSDLSQNFLSTHELIVPSAVGLDTLLKILNFKERLETSDGTATFFVDEM